MFNVEAIFAPNMIIDQLLGDTSEISSKLILSIARFLQSGIPMLANSKSSITWLSVMGNDQSFNSSPLSTNLCSSASSKPFGEPMLHRSVPCFAIAALNFLICHCRKEKQLATAEKSMQY